jgi:hypothetical protein
MSLTQIKNTLHFIAMLSIPAEKNHTASYGGGREESYYYVPYVLSAS